MGYRPPSTGSDLDFAGTQYEGLQVRMDSVPLRMLLEIGELAEGMQGGDLSQMRALFSMFAGLVEEWNVEDRKGEPVPATLDGVMSQDTAFVMAVITAWIKAVSSAPPPLPGSSDSGGSSEAALAAMAAQSSALPSSSPQKLLSGCATAGMCCRRRSLLSPRTCCGCSTSTSSVTARKTGSRRGVSSHRGQLRVDQREGDRRREA